MKTLFVLISFFAIVSVSLAAIHDTDVFESVSVLSVGDDAIRAYTVVQSDVFGFTAVGASVYGRISGNSGQFQADSNTFTLSTLTKLSYATTYASVNGQTGTSSGSISANFFGSFYNLYAIVEYNETNGSPGYQLSDNLLGWVNLGSLNFAVTSTSKTYNTTANGQSYSFPVYNVVATSTNNFVTLRFVVSGAPVSINGTDINSETSKIDIEISGYYDSSVNPQSVGCAVTGNRFGCKSTGASSNPNSRLALVSSYFITTAGASIDGHANGVAVNGAGPVTGKFDFVSQVTVNGTSATANVITNAVVFTPDNKVNITGGLVADANAHGQFLIQSFDTVRPSKVTWDPTVGVDRSFATTLIPSFTLLTVLIFALLF